MSLSAPLDLLREFTISKRPIELQGDFVVFEGTRLARSTPTAYRAQGGGFYAVDSLWFYLQKKDRKHGEYIAECGKLGIKPVSLLDKNKLYDYLTGNSDTSASIDIAGAAALVQAEHATSSAPMDDSHKEEEAIGDEMEMHVQDDEAGAEERDKAAEHAKQLAAEAKELLAKLIDGQLESAPAESAPAPAADLEADAAIAADVDETGEAAEARPERGEKRMSAARPYVKADHPVTKVILKRERRLRTRKSLLLAPAAASFPVLTQILDGFRKRNKLALEQEAKKARSRDHRPPPPSSRPSGSTGQHGGVSVPQPIHGGDGGSHKPAGKTHAYIIVPSVITSLVNLWNAQQLLQSKQYAPPIEVKEKGGTKPSVIKLMHTFEDGSKGLFQIIDNPLKLSSADWEHIVCVFVQGNSWQFKGWPFKSEAELFSKVLGVHLRFSDEQINQTVKAWRVQELLLSKQRTKQHEIGVTTMVFWQSLHKHMACHKPHLLLRPSHQR